VTATAEVLADLEQRLDPADPESGGAVGVVGYGEISCALRVAALPGVVCKRMSGFRDDPEVSAYAQLVADYVAELEAGGVQVAPTEVVPVPRAGRAPAVYLVQPELPADGLGHALLRSASDDTMARVVDRVLDAVLSLDAANRCRTDRVAVALDGQLSNWSFAVAGDEPGVPVLIDVGTPFLRRDGRHAIDIELLLRPVPVGIRTYYRRKHEIEAYLDDYFDVRLVAVDLLGNFHKEGRPDRIPLGLEVVNRRLGGPAVTADEVEAYYRKDADLLALYLRLRRIDRFARTKVLRRSYDYVLPGSVER
jgi:hypothetical protein